MILRHREMPVDLLRAEQWGGLESEEVFLPGVWCTWQNLWNIGNDVQKIVIILPKRGVGVAVDWGKSKSILRKMSRLASSMPLSGDRWSKTMGKRKGMDTLAHLMLDISFILCTFAICFIIIRDTDYYVVKIRRTTWPFLRCNMGWICSCLLQHNILRTVCW